MYHFFSLPRFPQSLPISKSLLCLALHFNLPSLVLCNGSTLFRRDGKRVPFNIFAPPPDLPLRLHPQNFVEKSFLTSFNSSQAVLFPQDPLSAPKHASHRPPISLTYFHLNHFVLTNSTQIALLQHSSSQSRPMLQNPRILFCISPACGQRARRHPPRRSTDGQQACRDPISWMHCRSYNLSNGTC